MLSNLKSGSTRPLRKFYWRLAVSYPQHLWSKEFDIQLIDIVGKGFAEIGYCFGKRDILWVFDDESLAREGMDKILKAALRDVEVSVICSVRML